MILYNAFMSTHSISSKAEDIRDVLRYIKKFKAASLVIYIDDRLLEQPLFTSHIRDIAMIHEAGIQVIIVPGARKRIDEASKRELNIEIDTKRCTYSLASCGQFEPTQSVPKFAS